MPLPAETILLAQTAIESISRTLLLVVSLVLVALLGGFFTSVFDTNVVGERRR